MKPRENIFLLDLSVPWRHYNGSPTRRIDHRAWDSGKVHPVHVFDSVGGVSITTRGSSLCKGPAHCKGGKHSDCYSSSASQQASLLRCRLCCGALCFATGFLSFKVTHQLKSTSSRGVRILIEL